MLSSRIVASRVTYCSIRVPKARACGESVIDPLAAEAGTEKVELEIARS
jgi:hypothetical protein